MFILLKCDYESPVRWTSTNGVEYNMPFRQAQWPLPKEVGVELVETSRSWCLFGYSPRQVGVRETASLSSFGHTKEVEYE